MDEPESVKMAQMGQHLRSIAAIGPSYWWHEHRNELVLTALPRASKRILDFGCGNGAFLHWLAPKMDEGTALCGYDVNSDTKALLPNRGSEITLLPSWPPSPGERGFDSIVAMDVIEHVEDDVGCLRSLAAALTLDGRLVVTVPAYRCFWSSWDVRLGHYRRYDKAMLSTALTQAGFTVERLTHLFTFLTGPALIRRLLPAKPANAPAAFAPLPRPMNTALRLLCAAERQVLAGVNLPFGTSLLAVARRQGGGERGADERA